MSEAARIGRFLSEATLKNVSIATRRLALGALSGVVLRTPVDTGRARGGWGVSLGSPSGEEDRSQDKSGSVVLAAGAVVIGQHKGYQQIVIDNNVPYIGRLNDGHSGQAPAGYVEGALAALGLGTGRE